MSDPGQRHAPDNPNQAQTITGSGSIKLGEIESEEVKYLRRQAESQAQELANTERRIRLQKKLDEIHAAVDALRWI